MNMPTIKKTLTTIVLVLTWTGIVSGVWWAFGPETFWQRLVMLGLVTIIGGISAIVLIFAGIFAWDHIDMADRRKKREQELKELNNQIRQ